MKNLKIQKVAAEGVNAASIPSLMQKCNVEYHSIDQVNWPTEYPYCPSVEFAIACCEDALLVHYRVTEQSVRAVAQKDQDPVWEDSCVEFFSCPGGDGLYYNIECNCTGKILLAVGPDRHQRERADESILQGITRWASLGSEPFDTIEETTPWEVALRIPYSTFWRHQIDTLSGKTFRANFYKCGDKLPVPHFVSWNRIDKPSPDFHCPEFFGEVTAE